MGLCPVDVVIVGFPGNKFSGRIAPALMELVDNSTIRIIDLLFVSKDANGVITTIKAADVDADTGPGYLAINVVQPGALGPEDAEELEEDLAPNSSALLIAFENIWARKLLEAARDADAVVMDHIRIPSDVVAAVVTAAQQTDKR
jgi:uncharacterized membrane protein